MQGGLSPRGRGKLRRVLQWTRDKRSIPAWAGETDFSTSCKNLQEVYPRVGGGNRCTASPPTRAAGLSPRGRGKRDRIKDMRAQHRSIPAWAGETATADRQNGTLRVYPRVGGGNKRSCEIIAATQGLSPRGRGKHGPMPRLRQERRSIPAWAGETAINHDRSPGIRVYPRVGGGNPRCTSF